MTFRVLGLSPAPFQHLFALGRDELAAAGAVRVIADDPRLPCRISMAHAAIGEELLLVNYQHQAANTPYRASHAIYVRKDAAVRYESIDTVPEVLSSRLIATRAFDQDHMMIDAEICEGALAAQVFARMLANENIRYLQVHNAIRGCYAAHVQRS